MTNKEYKLNEWRKFKNQTGCFYESIQEFERDARLQSEDSLERDLEWIENGSYGAGACLELSRVWQGCQKSKRGNKKAMIGQVLLAVLWGQAFPHWKKLAPLSKAALNASVEEWMDSPKEFSIEWED